MTIDEERIEESLEKIGKYLALADKNMRRVCLETAGIVGQYSSVTQAIADRFQRDVSTVENWAHAGQLLLELIKDGRYRLRAVQLWKTLSPSHWWRAWEIQNAGYKGFIYLDRAAKNRMSGRDMTEDWKREREGGFAPMLFDRGLVTWVNLAWELAKEPEYKKLPGNQRGLFERVMNEFQEKKGGE